MEKSYLQTYIGKRIRLLRLQKGMTQEQLEEKAELPFKYAYRLERVGTNIKIQTLEKVIGALDTTFEEFFELSLSIENPLLTELINKISGLPKQKQDKILQSILTIIEEIENP